MSDVANISIKPQIDASWLAILKEEFEKEYFKSLKLFLVKEKSGNIPIYPPGNQIFNAFNLCPFDQVRVVILGQDPYHGPNQAHGLCFSVAEGVPPPA
jgi:uracil-DNA glycosylase